MFKLSEKSKSLVLLLFVLSFAVGSVITLAGAIINNQLIERIGLFIYLPAVLILGGLQILGILALVFFIFTAIPDKLKNFKLTESIQGLVGIYALICFWTPVFWYTSHLMTKYDMGSFNYSNLSGLDMFLALE